MTFLQQQMYDVVVIMPSTKACRAPKPWICLLCGEMARNDDSYEADNINDELCNRFQSDSESARWIDGTQQRKKRVQKLAANNNNKPTPVICRTEMFQAAKTRGIFSFFFSLL